jgi:serine/threonine protein phosphatase PrpC
VVKSAYKCFTYTVKGGNHEKSEAVCQDHSDYGESRAVLIAAVSDGHGESNCFRSDRGAKFAVSCVIEAINEFASATPKPPPKHGFSAEDALKEMIGDLVRSVVRSWHGKVEEDVKNEPFTEKELSQCDEKNRKRFEGGGDPSKAYGATLIAAAVTNEYWFGFHIGDGRFTALRKNGEFSQPVVWDERCYLNVTTSICDYDANDRPRVYCELTADKKEPIAALFLCSDGIDDNYPVEDNEKHLYRFYAQSAIAFAKDGFDSTCKQLIEVCDSFAKKGKGDDVSLAAIVNMELIAQAAQTAELLKAAQAIAPKKAPPLPIAQTTDDDRSDAKGANAAQSNVDSSLKERQQKARKEYNIYNVLQGITLFLFVIVVVLGAYIVFDSANDDTSQVVVESEGYFAFDDNATNEQNQSEVVSENEDESANEPNSDKTNASVLDQAPNDEQNDEQNDETDRDESNESDQDSGAETINNTVTRLWI